jgi:hypothetical protein
MKGKLLIFIMALLLMLTVRTDVKASERNYAYRCITKDIVVTYTDKVMVEENEIVDITVYFCNNGNQNAILSLDNLTRN